MKPAPIQLVDYVVDQIRFELNPGYLRAGQLEEAEAPTSEDGSEEEVFAIQPNVLSFPDQETAGVLRLTVSLNEPREAWKYYRFTLSVVGRFKLIDPNPPVTEEVFRKYYLMSGFSILYGLLRGLLIQLCATSPYPRLVLPSVSFETMVDELLSGEAPAAPEA